MAAVSLFGNTNMATVTSCETLCRRHAVPAFNSHILNQNQSSSPAWRLWCAFALNSYCIVSYVIYFDYVHAFLRQSSKGRAILQHVEVHVLSPHFT